MARSSGSGEPVAVVLHPASLPVVERGGGARTIPLVTEELGTRELLNGITTFKPGAAIPWHKHNCEESVMVLEGSAVFEMSGSEHRLTRMDTTWIPAGIPHRFRNESDRDELTIFWTYASVNADRTIIETGQTRSIAEEHGRGKS